MTKYYYKKSKLKNLKKYIKLIAVLIIFLGISILFYFFFPLISWQFYFSSASASGIEVPIPKRFVLNNNVQSVFSERINSLTVNYEDARNWYPQVKGHLGKNKKISTYNLSIPNLKIENAVVATDDYELSSHLVQYFGTSTPGENGTSVIYGHSSLPQLFNPKDYKTIFATLHNLKVGDKIIANVSGITYNYKVFEIIITDPNDTSIFTQNYDDSYITLVTCTPPGTTWKRLIVKAKIIM